MGSQKWRLRRGATQRFAFLHRHSRPEDTVALGMAKQTGGENPNPGPRRREPDTKETRAQLDGRSVAMSQPKRARSWKRWIQPRVDLKRVCGRWWGGGLRGCVRWKS